MKYEPMDRRDIIVAWQAQTGVYVTESGYVAIRQENEMEDPSIILLAPEHVDAVIKAIKEAGKEAVEARQEFLFGGGDE